MGSLLPKGQNFSKKSRKVLVAPCFLLLKISQRTARCGSVHRRTACFGFDPEGPECWRGRMFELDRGQERKPVARKRTMSAEALHMSR